MTFSEVPFFQECLVLFAAVFSEVPFSRSVSFYLQRRFLKCPFLRLSSFFAVTFSDHFPACFITVTCIPADCSGHGTCTDGTRKCVCERGWEGDDCNTSKLR